MYTSIEKAVRTITAPETIERMDARRIADNDNRPVPRSWMNRSKVVLRSSYDLHSAWRTATATA